MGSLILRESSSSFDPGTPGRPNDAMMEDRLVARRQSWHKTFGTGVSIEPDHCASRMVISHP